jgi:hypothetical protein
MNHKRIVIGTQSDCADGWFPPRIISQNEMKGAGTNYKTQMDYLMESYTYTWV